MDKTRDEILKHIKECENSNSENNLKLIQKLITKFAGKFCSFHDSHYGYVIGATCDNFDYYWCYLTETGKIHFSTCCGNPVEVDYIPEGYEGLNRQITADPDYIFTCVKTMINSYDDIFFTDVYIGNKIYDRHEFIK